MSGSDPTSSSLNLSSDTVQGCVGEVASVRSRSSSSNTPSRNRSHQKMIQSGGSGRRPMSTIVKTMPRASSSRGPSPSHRGQGSVDVPVEVHHHQELHVHDDRTQTVSVVSSLPLECLILRKLLRGKLEQSHRLKENQKELEKL